MKVLGYKALNKGLKTFNGIQLEVGKVYVSDGILKYGNNGYHMCKNLEDTLRYVDGMNEEVDICEVIGFGEIHSYQDEYNEYFDNYVCEKMIITELLTYERIIDIMRDTYGERLKRFIQGYRLRKEEIEYFKSIDSYGAIIKYIKYYQEDDKKAFMR